MNSASASPTNSPKCSAIATPARSNAASACVLVHNHPAGNPEPSREDLEVTRAVARASDIVGIPLVDHVIVGGGSHVSLFDRGLLAPAEP